MRRGEGISAVRGCGSHSSMTAFSFPPGAYHDASCGAPPTHNQQLTTDNWLPLVTPAVKSRHSFGSGALWLEQGRVTTGISCYDRIGCASVRHLLGGGHETAPRVWKLSAIQAASLEKRMVRRNLSTPRPIRAGFCSMVPPPRSSVYSDRRPLLGSCISYPLWRSHLHRARGSQRLGTQKMGAKGST